MMRLTAEVATGRAGQYLTQLCKHFAHKIPVSYDAGQGRAEFPWGLCHLRAEADRLHLVCEAADAEALARVEYVVTDHLTRFSHRDPVELRWQAG